MKKYWKEFRKFGEDRLYVLVLALAAVCAYGFMVTHPTVGIDDTPYQYYFEDGLAAIVGRWVIFLLNKVVHVADFAPFITDFAGVLILMAAVTLWAVLFRDILEAAHLGSTDSVLSIPRYGYLFFSAIFISCPLISEVYTYYLHNGIAIGYLSCGISLCCFREGLLRLDARSERRGWRAVWPAAKAFLGAAISMWIAMGCYESFMIVWLQGICLMLLTERFAGVRRKMLRTLCIAGCVALLGMILRSVMIQLVTGVFGLEYLKDDAVQRSVTEMVEWVLQPGALSELKMVLKRMFVMYGVFAYAYYPIKIFVLAFAVIAVFSVWRAIRGRDFRTFFLMVAGMSVPLLLAVIECKATYYRSAQFLPLVCGYGALLVVYGLENVLDFFRKKAKQIKIVSVVRGIGIGLLCVVLWNQCTDMNKWFYVDYQKYEAAKDYVGEIAYELEKNYDTSKPVVFTGGYEVPESLIKDAYVPIGSETFFKMKRITDMVDEHLLEKFYRSYGVWVAQTPVLSVIDWGHYAFDTDEELVRFFTMHGYEIVPMLEKGVYAEAEQYSYEMNLPKFPIEGSIVDMGDYIIVHL